MTTKDQPWISPLSGEEMEFVKYFPGVPDTWEEAFLWYMQDMLIEGLDEKTQLGPDGEFRLRGESVTHLGIDKYCRELAYGIMRDEEIVWLFRTTGLRSKLVKVDPNQGISRTQANGLQIGNIWKLLNQFPDPTPEALQKTSRK